MTFREAYQRTGRILNVSCVPSDPHSPTILANYLTAPDCVIWSAVIASAAVPGILNPVVLMKKSRSGKLEPYSFGHKWKDGSLRTDVPLKALNLHFNVNFSIVSQVNPHINLFFFSSRGTVGRPVTHRRGRGWRGGFLGSATEQYLKLDLTKWLKVLRHLELLPRPLGQDWSEIWLQRFSGTITIWPKSIPSDFYYILSDPTPSRLARMIHMGELATWPKLKFIANRMKVERLIEDGRRATRPQYPDGAITNILSEEDLQALLRNVKANHRPTAPRPQVYSPVDDSSPEWPLTPALRHRDKPLPRTPESPVAATPGHESPTLSSRFSGWWNRSKTSLDERPSSMYEMRPKAKTFVYQQIMASPSAIDHGRRSSLVDELSRQSAVFFDDSDFEKEEDSGSEDEVVEEAETEGEDDYQQELGVDDVDGSVSGGSNEREEHASERAEGPTVVG